MANPINLLQMLMARASAAPALELYSYISDGEPRALSAGELISKAKAIGGCLQKLGMAGKPVLLICRPGLEPIVGLFGCILAGAIAVPLPRPGRRGKNARILAVLEDCGAGAVLGFGQDEIPSLVEMTSASRTPWLIGEDIADEHANDWIVPQIKGTSLAFIQYTSGSTGTPKGVMVSHSNVLNNAAEMQEAFDINSTDRGVSWLPFYHDMGLAGGIIQPVYSGYPTTIMSPLAFIEGPARWLEAISSTRATLSGGPNFAYELCVQKVRQELTADLDLSSWRVAFNGSEPVRHETLRAFSSKFKGCGFNENAFRPCYGLAEATLLVSAQNSSIHSVLHVDSGALKRGKAKEVPESALGSKSLMGTGEPGSRNSVAVVKPETFGRCAENEVGEIWISGPSVAQGYWKKLNETRKTFHARPRRDKTGHYLRTGDLGFIRDKQLFITGRLKDLIIIRGQNYYPQDIEDTVAKSHPELGRGRGAAFSIEAAEGERLVVVHEVERKAEATDHDVIVRCIREQVANEHQLRAYAVVLIRAGTLPKTSSGKVQRKTCKEQFLSCSLKEVFRSIDPDGATETQLAASAPLDDAQRHGSTLSCVVDALAIVPQGRLHDVGAETPLSAFGIDSLRAAQIKVAIEKKTGVEVPISRLLQNESVQALVDFIETRRGAVVWPEKEVTFASTLYPLSAGQKALWYLQQLEPESPDHTIARAFKVRGFLDVDVFRMAFRFLLQRHPSLRMVVSSNGSGLLQDVSKHRELTFESIDAEGWDDAEIQAQLTAGAQRPFDLSSGPLLRLQVYRRSNAEAVILLVVHHIALDLWSFSQLAAELPLIYGALKKGQAPDLAPLTKQYGDFVEWQEQLLSSRRGGELSEYWLSRLEHAPPALALPVSAQQSSVQQIRTSFFEIEGHLSAQLAAFAETHHVTLHALLMAAFEVLLHRYTGQADFLVGMLSSGRNQTCSADVVGYFVNPVVLRPDFSSNPPFVEYLQQSYRNLLAALDHGDLPFSVLVEQLHANRNASRSPLVQVMCIFQPSRVGNIEGLTPFIMGQTGGSFAVDDLLFESTEFSESGTQFDLTLVACHGDDKIAAAIKYDANRFDPEFIARMAQHYLVLLGSIVDDASLTVRELSILTEAERRQITLDWNNTERAVSDDVCIHHLIQQQVDRTPDATALVCEGVQLTYRELDIRANRVAHYFRQLGVTAESKVGLYLERSLDIVVTILAVLKTGGAYVPLDPSHPVERTQVILGASGAALIVTSGYLATRLDLPAGVRAICMEQDAGHISKCSSDRIESGASPKNVAYVMYTSGSTGKPKGVMIEHRNVVNFFQGMDEKVGCSPDDTLLAVTSVSFDISILELLWPLTRGTRVIIVHDQALHRGTGQKQVRQHAKEVQFSLFYFASADAQGAQDHYQMLIEGAKLADQLGLTAVWTPERHFHAFGGMYPNPSLTNAALAMITSRIHLRAGSVVLPLHNPIRVAEEWALVDQLSRGRVGIAFASGWHADDFVFAPENYAERKQIMYRGIETVQQLWHGDSIKVRGGAGHDIEVKIHPQPVQPELPVWITSSGSLDTFEAAARIHANVLTHLLGQEIHEVGEKIKLYRKGWGADGQGPASGVVTLMLHTYIDNNLDQVRRKALQPFKNYLRSSVGLIASLVRSLKLDLDLNNMQEGDLDDLLTFAAERYMGTSGLFGTLETCTNMVDAAREIGANEIACLVDFGVDFASTMQSIRHIQELQLQFNRTSSPVDDSLQSQAVRYGATMLQCTPSLVRMLLHGQSGADVLSSLRVLLLGGEAVPLPLVQEVRKTYQGPILNMYGPTETTIWSAVQPVDTEENKVLIGGPIANTQVYVLGPGLGPCPVGITGELYIGGSGLARGYLGDPTLTAERFLPNPFSPVPGARVYRTGDLARFQNDGRIDIAGRVDEQVKVRGHRIELGDIDATLNKAPGVGTGVTIKAGAAGEEELIAYLVASNGEIDLTEVRSFLRKHLPPYMVPGKLHVVNHLPLTPNGKIDRKSLIKVQVQQRPAPLQALLPPTDGLQGAVLNIWKEVLRAENISVDDNFFDIGGHSLLMVQVHERLQRVLERTFPLITLLQHPTIRSISSFLETSGHAYAMPNSEKLSRQRSAVLAQRNRASAVRVQ